nr:ImmA/IrrE family metallo-endopeptidase [uncultured Pseudomonas sp.]
MTPEEKMAARVLLRNSLEPPYDLLSLAKKYGDVEYIYFPITADGVTVGIGGSERPNILINESAPESRQKFTLAHELGHVIIPWHTGIIVSHLNDDGDDYEYREMESEANRFAAELLIPTAWLIAEYEKFPSFSEYLKHVVNITGASRDAVLIKIFRSLSAPVVCVEVDVNGRSIHQFRTGNAPQIPALEGRDLKVEKVFKSNNVFDIFSVGDKLYVSWVFTSIIIEENDPRPWREVLDQILSDCDAVSILKNVNAILPARYQKCKHLSESEICNSVMHAYEGRDYLENFDKVISHPLFEQYVVKRVRELLAKDGR